MQEGWTPDPARPCLRDDDPVDSEVTAGRERALQAGLASVASDHSSTAENVRREFTAHLDQRTGADTQDTTRSAHEVVRYFGGTGTSIFDVAVYPASGDVWVSNTEALNLIRFEPELRGHFIDNRLTRIAQGFRGANNFRPESGN
jgi:hypothetical protein